MGIIRNIQPELPLRLGLAATFLYSGLDLLRHPTSWHWALNPVLNKMPASIKALIETDIGINTFLQIQGGIELVYVLLLLTWFLPKKILMATAFVISAEMLGIVLLTGVDAITFRDFGLLGAGIALYVIASKK